MGGTGSGRRWHYSAKETTTDYRVLDVRRLHKEGVLVDGNAVNWCWYRGREQRAFITIYAKADHIILDYRFRTRGEEEWRPYQYGVPLDWTICHLGGQRPWLRCPIKGCSRRVAILYGSELFACRHCLKLAYSSQRETEYDRLARRADRIRDKLGWEPGILNRSGWGKPKGMHWKTFERLVGEHDRLVEASLRGMAIKMRLVGDSIEDWI